jgi:hypothetical protein
LLGFYEKYLLLPNKSLKLTWRSLAVRPFGLARLRQAAYL